MHVILKCSSDKIEVTYQRKTSDMPRKQILKSCHSNSKTSKSARAETYTFLVGLVE